jgi:hypothetical protein
LLKEDVKHHLMTPQDTLGGSYAEFEACLERAVAISHAQPEEFIHRFNVSLNPRLLGSDIRQSFLGLLDDQIGFLGMIEFTTCLKLGELASGIAESLNAGQFRVSVICSRALYEEAAALSYYWEQSRLAIDRMISVAPSSFRLNRLRQMLVSDKDGLGDLVKQIGDVNAIVRKWYSARRIDVRKPDFIQDYRLDKKDPLWQGFTLSALKSAEWAGKPAELYYALLCEATHPNIGANGLYVDETSVSSGSACYVLRKERRSLEVYSYVFDLVCRPTIECVRLIDRILNDLHRGKREIENFATKVRQAP